MLGRARMRASIFANLGVNVSRDGQVDSVGVVLIIEIDAAVEGACPVCGLFVE